MRRNLKWVVGLGLTLAIGASGIVLAASAPTTIVRAGNLVLKLSGELTPRVLPKGVPAPVGLHERTSLTTIDGSQPPALEELVFDADRNVFVDVQGLPVCGRGKLEARDAATAKRACPDAILGEGSASVRVAFPEQTPFEAIGPLTVFNGGVENGVTTLFVHAYVSVPAPTAIVATVKITKEHKGRFGLHIVVLVPKVAGGSGSVTHTELSARRLFAYKGRRRSFLSARCSGGRFLARGTLGFRDGTKLFGSFVVPCRATD
ncbi:MAG TPA: hypothetical protein VII45_10710 [Solirubrobacterales bacterium]